MLFSYAIISLAIGVLAASASYVSDGALSVNEENIGYKLTAPRYYGVDRYLVVFDEHHSLVNSSLMYAVCDRYVEPKTIDKNASINGNQSCTIHFEDPTIGERSCSFYLRTVTNSTEVIRDDRVKLLPLLDGRKALVFWQEAATWKLVYVDLAGDDDNDDSCSVRNFTMTMEPRVKFAVHHENHSDLIVREEKYCQKFYCRLRLKNNDEGEIKLEPWLEGVIDPAVSEVIDLVPVIPDSSYLMIEQLNDNGGKNLRLSLLKDGDSIVTLKNYSNLDVRKNTYQQLASSISYDTLSVCVVTQKRIIICDRFDMTGKSLLTKVIEIDYEPREIAIYNLPRAAGLILTIAQCKSSLCDGDANVYQTMLINEDAEMIAESKFRKSACSRAKNDYAKTKMYENELGQYCLSSVCYNASPDRRYRYHAWDSNEQRTKTTRGFKLDVTCVADPRFWS
ncbi:uncharacterized protein LOC106659437 [Trichogramma pretiosum]|uniref:uncharacterized protein LOC106659437 n=1 Tax=Trichogramma pretiosum TaxID=7493 RepID=UPI0006C96AD9|nr:uncharacterized protein LOC106659437 [Trichogramma pretiosum]